MHTRSAVAQQSVLTAWQRNPKGALRRESRWIRGESVPRRVSHGRVRRVAPNDRPVLCVGAHMPPKNGGFARGEIGEMRQREAGSGYRRVQL